MRQKNSLYGLMTYKRSVNSILFIIIVISMMALIFLLPVYKAWENNIWSVQFIHNMFNTTANHTTLVAPPGHPHAALWIASDTLRAGNPSLAEKLIASQASQGDRLALYLMANAFMAQGDFAKAIGISKQVGNVTFLLQVASKAQLAGHSHEALEAYQYVWTIDPESGTMPLVNFLVNASKDYGTAENILRQSLATRPNSKNWPQWSDRLGDVMRYQKLWTEADRAYKNALDRMPDDWAALIGLGWVSYERGDGIQPALLEFKKAINVPGSKGNGQLAIAQVLIREKRFGEADDWFAQALALNPDVQVWYVERGDTALRAGNLRLALNVYQEALTRFPDYALAYYDIAFAYQLNGQPTQAKVAIEKALVLMAPPDPNYYFRAGQIYESAGDKSKALDSYRQALLIDPQNVLALKAVDRLRK